MLVGGIYIFPYSYIALNSRNLMFEILHSVNNKKKKVFKFVYVRFCCSLFATLAKLVDYCGLTIIRSYQLEIQPVLRYVELFENYAFYTQTNRSGFFLFLALFICVHCVISSRRFFFFNVISV